MASYTKTIGDIGVAVITAEFLKHGIKILVPYDDNSPYDIVIYINNKFYKIQIKTTEQVINGCMIFNACKTNPYTKKNILYTKEEVDFFALYCLENGWCGLISYDEYTSKEIKIRMQPPQNNQFDKCKFVDDYNLNVQIMKIFNLDLIKNTIIKKEIKKYKKHYKKKLCPICKSKEIGIESGMCRACYNKLRRKG